MHRFEVIMLWCVARLKEPSTWQAIGFVVGLCGAKYGADFDWGQGAAVGGFISAIIKAVVPEPVLAQLNKEAGNG